MKHLWVKSYFLFSDTVALSFKYKILKLVETKVTVCLKGSKSALGEFLKIGQ